MAPHFSLFFRQLLRGPQAISAVAPSSAALARAMAATLVPGMKVAEFGPGTGALTGAVLGKIAPQDLTLFEMNPDFAAHLREVLPGVTVHNAPAQQIGVREAERGVFHDQIVEEDQVEIDRAHGVLVLAAHPAEIAAQAALHAHHQMFPRAQ